MKKQSIVLCVAALLIGCGGGGTSEIDYDNSLSVIERPARFAGTGPNFEPAVPPQEPPFRTPEENHPTDRFADLPGVNPPTQTPGGGGPGNGGGSGAGTNCTSLCQGEPTCVAACEELCAATDACSVCLCNNIVNPEVCLDQCI